MLGTANFRAGRVWLHERTPLLPDRTPPLSRSAEQSVPEIAERVRALCVKYDLPYTTGPFLRQYLLTVRTICKLALPVDSCRPPATTHRRQPRRTSFDTRTGSVSTSSIDDGGGDADW